MKTKVLVLCFCIFSISSVFAENWFVGGSFSFNFSNNESPGSGSTLSTADYKQVNIYPVVGYNLNKFDIGLYPIFEFRQTKNISGSGSSSTAKDYGFGAGVFSRYKFLSFKNLSILGNLSIDYTYLNSKINNISSSTTAIDRNTDNHTIKMKLVPVFEYKLFDFFSLYTDLGIGGIGGIYEYRHTTQTTNISGIKEKQSFRGSNFSLDLPSIFYLEITKFSLGFYFHF